MQENNQVFKVSDNYNFTLITTGVNCFLNNNYLIIILKLNLFINSLIYSTHKVDTTMFFYVIK